MLDNAADGEYTIKVHYWHTHGLGPSSPSVRVWVAGNQLTFGPRQMSFGQVWDVATIDWSTARVTVIDRISDWSPQSGAPLKNVP